MGRARRMDDEAFGISDVREMRPQRHPADKILPGLPAPADVEGKHGAGALGQVLVDEWPVPASWNPWIGDALDHRMRLEVVRDRESIVDVTLHAERERFQSLKEQERVERAHRRAEVA